MIKQHFPEQAGRIATGRVGPGSECFGFDKESDDTAMTSFKTYLENELKTYSGKTLTLLLTRISSTNKKAL